MSFTVLSPGINPVHNREIGINFCTTNGYQYIIFCDIDDTFASNRISVSLSYLENHDIVVNDLSLFDKNGIIEHKYISNRIMSEQIIDFEFIKLKNIFGLSNTAMKVEQNTIYRLPKSIIAVDWYLFALELIKKKKAIFTDKTVTYYRQHDNNLVGLKATTPESIQHGQLVKRSHYQAMSKISDSFEGLLEYYTSDRIDHSIITSQFPLWWESL